MKNVLKANMYFLIIMLLQVFLPIHRIFNSFNITDDRVGTGSRSPLPP